MLNPMHVSEIYSGTGTKLSSFFPKKRNPGAEALGFVGCSAKDAEVQQVGQVGTEHLTEDVGDRDG